MCYRGIPSMIFPTPRVMQCSLEHFTETSFPSG